MQETTNEWGNWEQFNLANGNVFQSKGFASALKETNTEIKLLLLKDNKNAIIGGAYYFFPLSGLKKHFSELRVISGPVLKDSSHLKYVLRSLNELAKKNHSICIQLRLNTKDIPAPIHEQQEMLTKEGFTVLGKAPAYSFNLDLNHPLEILKNNLNKNTRNAITKAEREGVTVEKTDDIDLAYSLYINRAKEKDGQIPYPKSYFKEIHKHTNSTILIAKYNGVPIAESMFIEYNNVISYFNNGSLPEHWNLNPNTLLIWHMIKTNANTNKILNLYGVCDGTDPEDINYGIFKFKSGFGGILEEEFIYAKKVISPKKQFLFEKAIKHLLPIYKKLQR